MTRDVTPEPVRLVIWDLDDTFWDGTLTEGGIAYRRDHHDIVRELARRGIVSAICSKNDLAPARAMLEREGIWDSFVFPSINWQAKGPRLAALVQAMQLRAPTVMFIDDNPMNRAEALHFVPGIQVQDASFIAEILEHPNFRGKDDSDLTRLAQYKTLQRRQADATAARADTADFLRGSNIRVCIDHDLHAQLDRAIELINRTNQLNFTKTRLPEDPEAARAELRALLSEYNVQAGILRVRDNYGDYGYCGLYIVRTGARMHRLLHFAFSCRILDMGVETWLYRQLGRPDLKITGKVAIDIVQDQRNIDWISTEQPGPHGDDGQAITLDYLYARGGCDLHAVAHYFSLTAAAVHKEFNFVRRGTTLRTDHSVFAKYAIAGVSAAAIAAVRPLGYEPEDFNSLVTSLPDTPRAAWLLSFWTDSQQALYQHKKTGIRVPMLLLSQVSRKRDITECDPEFIDNPADAARLTMLRENFTYAGLIEQPEFTENLNLLLDRAPQRTTVFILLASELDRGAADAPPVDCPVNRWVRAATAPRRNVVLLSIDDFIHDISEILTDFHYDRIVYFRVFQAIMRHFA